MWKIIFKLIKLNKVESLFIKQVHSSNEDNPINPKEIVLLQTKQKQKMKSKTNKSNKWTHKIVRVSDMNYPKGSTANLLHYLYLIWGAGISHLNHFFAYYCRRDKKKR